MNPIAVKGQECPFPLISMQVNAIRIPLNRNYTELQMRPILMSAIIVMGLAPTAIDSSPAETRPEGRAQKNPKAFRPSGFS